VNALSRPNVGLHAHAGHRIAPGTSTNLRTSHEAVPHLPVTSAIAAVGLVRGARGRRQGWQPPAGLHEKYVLVADEQYQAREGSHLITDRLSGTIMRKLFIGLMVAAALASLASPAQARTRHHRCPACVRTRQFRLDGHMVRYTSWRPGLSRVIGHVAFSRRHKRVEAFAHAGSRRTPSIAAINASTWNWASGIPTGTLWTNGTQITGLNDRPAVGFVGSNVVFGARLAAEEGAKNIVSGPAYLLRGGEVESSFPYAANAQIHCAAPRTDGGYGCWRSIVATFKNGRAAVLEISFASMPTAAHILQMMGATNAIAFDSGGSATMWTRAGSGGCYAYHYVGHCFGSLHYAHMGYERTIPDAVVISKT
jgi:hypothetical protein